MFLSFFFSFFLHELLNFYGLNLLIMLGVLHFFFFYPFFLEYVINTLALVQILGYVLLLYFFLSFFFFFFWDLFRGRPGSRI